MWPEPKLRVRRIGLTGTGGVDRSSHTGPEGTRESSKVLGSLTWSDCGFRRPFWLQSRDWLGGSGWELERVGDIFKGPDEK